MNSESPDRYKIAKIWFFFCIITLIVCILYQGSTYMEIDAFGIWFLSCLTILFMSQKKNEPFSKIQQRIIVFIGFLMCLLSFISIPLGITNPPYTIGEFSCLLSGAGVIIFGLYNFRSFILPVSIPFIAVMGFGAYELFLRNQDWLTAPLIPPIITLVTLILGALSINPVVDGNIISFMSQNGAPIYLAIVSDCTGIWSLGTFTIALILVLSSFPVRISIKTVLFIIIGYLGTIAANILRIITISLSGFYFGPTGIIEQVHIHIGWIFFTLWMIIFWYYYFTRLLGITFSPTKKNDKNAGNS
jgi:exosortase